MKSQATIEKTDDHTAKVSGVIDVNSAMQLKLDGEKLIKSLQNTICIDLSGIEQSGSVGVSVMLAWMRAAAAEGKEIQFLDMPPKMFDVARVSGLDEVFPLANSQNHS